MRRVPPHQAGLDLPDEEAGVFREEGVHADQAVEQWWRRGRVGFVLGDHPSRDQGEEEK